MRLRIKGFSLIELVIAVAILGIITSIAYPSYLNQVKRARRADAFAAMQEFAAAMERFYTMNGSYLGAANGGADTGPPAVPGTFNKSTSPIDGNDIFYNLTIQTASETGFILRASPVNAQSGDGNIEITHTGRRGWDRNGDGDTTDAGEDDW